MRFRNRIHRAAIEVAKAIGGGWSNFKLAFTVIKSTVFAPQAVGERLIELFSLCYLKLGTDRPMLDFRGDVVLAVEKLVGPLPEGDLRNYMVTTHQRRYMASAVFLLEHGISARHPLMLGSAERQELRALILAARWGEAEGYFEKSWTVRDDGSLEVGLTPTGRPIDANPEDVVLFQHRVDKTEDTQRLRWVHILESKRTSRKDVITYPIFDIKSTKGGGTVLKEVGYTTGEFDPNDSQDRFDDHVQDFDSQVFAGSAHKRFRMKMLGTDNLIASGGHPGYCGLVPLRSPTLVENQLLLRRVRARMSWEVRAYSVQGDSATRISKNKEILCSDGRIWTPEDADGNPEQDYFADPRQVLSWKDKESGRFITVKRWNKLVMQKAYLEFRVPKGPNEKGYELYDHIRGRDIPSDQAISHLHDKSVTVLRDPTFRRELEGVFLSAVENMRYARLEFFHKERGLGSPAKPVITRTMLHDGTVAVSKVPCKRCDEKWGAVQDAQKALWVELPHAYVCNACGSEIWKVGVRVFVDKKYFPFVRHCSDAVTHYSAEFFGHWVMELLNNGAKAGANYPVRKMSRRSRAKLRKRLRRRMDPHRYAMHQLRHNIIKRLKAQMVEDLKQAKRRRARRLEYRAQHPELYAS